MEVEDSQTVYGTVGKGPEPHGEEKSKSIWCSGWDVWIREKLGGSQAWEEGEFKHVSLMARRQRCWAKAKPFKPAGLVRTEPGDILSKTGDKHLAK